MINFSKREYKKLLRNGIEGNEGTIFVNPYNSDKIIKTILEIPDVPEYLPMKIDTIEKLLGNREILKELSLTTPEELVLVDGVKRGFSTSNIIGLLLEDILFDVRISISIKINYLKQIGKLLRDMSQIRKNTHLKKLFYNDMHEGNFIVSLGGTVYGIDPDSFSILDNTPSSGYYASELVDLIPYDCQKYKMCDQVCIYSAEIIPNENLDLYCYIRMILNFMYGMEIDFLNHDRLFDYLDFLEHYGANTELLDIFARIYDYDVDNINPDYLLDHIKSIYEYANINYDKSGKLKRVLK